MTEIVNYYVALLSRRDIPAYVALACAGLVIVLALVGFFKGARRGIGRQGVRTVTVAISAVLAYFATHSMLPMVIDFFKGKSVIEVLAMVKLDGFLGTLAPEFTEILSNMDATTVSDVLTMPLAVFVLPILFAALFILISGLMLLVHACVAGILGYTKKNNNFFTRLLGALLGLVQGVLVAALLLVPVSGIVNVAEEASARSEDEQSVVTVVYQGYLEEVSHSPLHELVTKYGGEQLYKSLTTVSTDKTSVDARESVYNILHIVDVYKGLGEESITEMNEEQQAALTEIVDCIGKDPYTAKAAAGLIRAMLMSDTVRASVLEKFDEPFRSFFAEWIDVLSGCTKETLHEDLDTIVDAIIIMADHGVLDAFMAHNADDMRNALISVDEGGETAINLLVNRFNENERTAHLVTTLARLSLTLMAGDNELGLDDATIDTFNNVKDGLAESVLTIDKSTYGEDTEAYVNDVADALDSVLTENSITLSDEALNEMAEYISENNETISSLEALDDTTVTNILIQYYVTYMNS